MSTRVDLSQLAVHRDAAIRERPRRRHLLLRVGLPTLLLAGFAALLVHAARETLSPPRHVTVLPVLLMQTTLVQPADTPLFRAAGWVEPRPTPVLVTALAEGVVEKLLVVEGQEVKAGQSVARLVTTDARLALESAQADLQLREAELTAAEAVLTAARARAERPLHLQVELADAEAALAGKETDHATVPFQLRAAQARRAAARRDWTYRRSSSAVPPASVATAKSELEAAEAAVEELLARQKRLPAEVAALRDRRDALRRKLEHKVDEVRAVAEARAGVQTALARRRQARAALARAELHLARMEVQSPVSGRVLTLVARPGMRLTGLNPGSLHDASTVLTVYDPAALQVRVDVRLDDVWRIQPGLKTRIETAAVPGRALEGRVLLATSQADVQKNTLSVKVAIADPPPTLRPEMLCQVTFLSPPPAANQDDSGENNPPTRLLVPRQLIDSGGGSPGVWVADRLTGTARYQTVELGSTAGDLVEVTAGLSSTEKLIVGGRDGLRNGDRVHVAGEDETLGIADRRR